MSAKIKQQILLIILMGNVFCSFGQSSSYRGPTIERISLIIYDMLFCPKDTLKPVKKFDFCENESTTFFLHGLELPIDSLIKLKLTLKNTIENQCFYELRYKDNNKSNCVEHTNYYITTKIPIFLNGEEIPFEKSFEILSSMSPNEMLSINRRHPYSKKKGRIEILTKF